MSEAEGRARVVSVAKTWLRTPYHPQAMKRGVGVDCATMLASVYPEAGIIPAVQIDHYPPDWHLHRSEERYLNTVLQHAKEIQGPPQPGDIALWRFGRCFSHGAIVIEWPVIIHAFLGQCVQFDDANSCSWLRYVGESGPHQGKERAVKFFSYWG